MPAKRGAGYRPARFDPKGVQLERHMVSLIDQLGRINHDIWAWNRQREGWRWGVRRDDDRKLHPNLVPYEELREDEKQYDRNAAETTIKALVALGYRIAPPDGAPAGEEPAETARKIEAARVFVDSAELPALLRMWQEHTPRSWAGATDLYARLAKRFSSAGEHLLAYEAATEGLSLEPSHDRLRHAQALALANTGATRAAHDLAAKLAAEVTDPKVCEDAIALVGRTQKDLAFAAPDPETRRAHFFESFEAYRDAFQRTGGYYSAINAATTALLAGDRKDARRFAAKAEKLARREVSSSAKPAASDYWALATIGEAVFILGRTAEAKRWYAAASKSAGSRYGHVASMRRQLRVLAAAMHGREPAWSAKVFRIPAVAVFASDGARATRSLDGSLRAAVERFDVGFGYASAVPPGDILFHEAVVEAGGKSFVVLPCPRDEFLAREFGGRSHGWVRRFDRLVPDPGVDAELERRHEAAEVCVASAGGFADDALMAEYTDLLTLGLARIHSLQLETRLVLLAADGDGATARRWRGQGYTVEALNHGARKRAGRS